tara:strand:- start:3129 stop:3311 length:183 start_codon:yes stop_codon:yes gene_type:complete
MSININNLRPMRKLGQCIKDFFNPKIAIMRFELKAKSLDEKLNKMNAAWNLLDDEIKVEE